MPEPRINTGFRHFCPIFGHPSLSSKGKILYLTYFLFQGILGLPSRSWLALSFFSLISRYSSIFKAFSMVLSKRKRPHRMDFPLYKVLLFLNIFSSLGYGFLSLEDKGMCLGIWRIWPCKGIITLIFHLVSSYSKTLSAHSRYFFHILKHLLYYNKI